MIALPVGWFLWDRLENEKPAINMDLASPHLGRAQQQAQQQAGGGT